MLDLLMLFISNHCHWRRY